MPQPTQVPPDHEVRRTGPRARGHGAAVRTREPALDQPQDKVRGRQVSVGLAPRAREVDGVMRVSGSVESLLTAPAAGGDRGALADVGGDQPLELEGRGSAICTTLRTSPAWHRAPLALGRHPPLGLRDPHISASVMAALRRAGAVIHLVPHRDLPALLPRQREYDVSGNCRPRDPTPRVESPSLRAATCPVKRSARTQSAHLCVDGELSDTYLRLLITE